MTKKKKGAAPLPERKQTVLHLLCLTLAGMINACGVTLFLSPVSLYDSGFSGTAMLLGQCTALPLSLFLLILNVPFFLYGLKRQGLRFTLYSLYAVIIYALAAFVITDLLPWDVRTSSPFAGQDLLLCAVFGGLVSGAGSGLTIRFGGAIDGVEVLAVIFSGSLGISVGTFVLLYNVLLYIAAGIVCGSWLLPLYSIITYAVGNKAVDFLVQGFDRAKAAMIITDKPAYVSLALSSAFGSGITQLSGKGYYTSQDKTVIYFVVNRFQIGKLKKLVLQQDPNAFIAISEVSELTKRAG